MWGHGFYTYGFSALFKPISEELDFSRAVTSVAAGIGRIEGGIESAFTGWATDKIGPKWIVLPSVFVLGLGLILMNFINSLWAYYVVWGVIVGTGVNIALALPWGVALSNWFVKKRGRAMGIRSVLSGLSGVVILPLVAFLISTEGWRMTCVIGGVGMWLVGLPLSWFTLKRYRPEYYGLLPDGVTTEEEIVDKSKMIDKGVEYAAKVEEVEFTLRQALRTPAYWMIIIGNTCHALSGPAFGMHAIPFLTDMGIDPLVAAGMFSMMVFAGIPARLIAGLIADRVGKRDLRWIKGGAYLLQALGFTFYLLNPTMPMVYTWFILYGIGQGAGFGIMMPMWARLYGRKAFGSISGFSRLFMAPLGIIAPVYVGWVYDTTGSYVSAFTVIAALLAVAAVIIFFVLPPKPPAQPTDIRKIV